MVVTAVSLVFSQSKLFLWAVTVLATSSGVIIEHVKVTFRVVAKDPSTTGTLDSA
jgi:hypothetical protein